MPKFIVPEVLAPGVGRGRAGFHKPFSRFSYPDAQTERKKQAGKKDRLPWRLLPADKEGYDLLCKMWPEFKDKIAKPSEHVAPVVKQEPAKTNRELVEEFSPELEELTGSSAVAEVEERSKPETKPSPKPKSKTRSRKTKAQREADK